MVQLVSFDVWGTLLRSNKEYKRLQRELIRDAFGYTGELQELRLLIHKVYVELDRHTERTGIHFGMAERLIRIASHVGLAVPSDDVFAAIKAELTELQLAYMPYLTEPELPELFKALKSSGKQLAVISNTNMTEGAAVHEMLAYHGLAHYLDIELYSDELGVAKPNPRIFAALVERTQAPHGQIVHIGNDQITDVQGATSFGLGAILYERRQRLPQSNNVIWSHSSLPALLV